MFTKKTIMKPRIRAIGVMLAFCSIAVLSSCGTGKKLRAAQADNQRLDSTARALGTQVSD